MRTNNNIRVFCNNKKLTIILFASKFRTLGFLVIYTYFGMKGIGRHVESDWAMDDTWMEVRAVVMTARWMGRIEREVQPIAVLEHVRYGSKVSTLYLYVARHIDTHYTESYIFFVLSFCFFIKKSISFCGYWFLNIFKFCLFMIKKWWKIYGIQGVCEFLI